MIDHNELLRKAQDINTYHALTEQLALLREENERLRAVVDAARVVAKRWDTRGLGNPLPGESPTDADCLNAMSDAIRALGGEEVEHE